MEAGEGEAALPRQRIILRTLKLPQTLILKLLVAQPLADAVAEPLHFFVAEDLVNVHVVLIENVFQSHFQ